MFDIISFCNHIKAKDNFPLITLKEMSRGETKVLRFNEPSKKSTIEAHAFAEKNKKASKPIVNTSNILFQIAQLM